MEQTHGSHDHFGIIWTLIRTDFKLRYYGSFGGFLWTFLKPLIVFITLLAIFSIMFGNKGDYALRLVIGLFLWDFSWFCPDGSGFSFPDPFSTIPAALLCWTGKGICSGPGSQMMDSGGFLPSIQFRKNTSKQSCYTKTDSSIIIRGLIHCP